MNQVIDKVLTVIMSPLAPLIIGAVNVVLATNNVMYLTGTLLIIIGRLDWYDNWKASK
jgi:hypothetical protein